MTKKGYKQTAEHSAKISAAQIRAEQNKEKNNPFYGKHHSVEARKKISEAAKKRIGILNPMYGKRHTEKTRQQISRSNKELWEDLEYAKTRSGRNSPNWRGGYRYKSGSESRWGCYGADYGRQRNLARKRDNYTCFCGLCEIEKTHETHHIVPYWISKDNSLDNLWTCCCKCHEKIETLTAKVILE